MKPISELRLEKCPVCRAAIDAESTGCRRCKSDLKPILLCYEWARYSVLKARKFTATGNHNDAKKCTDLAASYVGYEKLKDFLS